MCQRACVAGYLFLIALACRGPGAFVGEYLVEIELGVGGLRL